MGKRQLMSYHQTHQQVQTSSLLHCFSSIDGNWSGPADEFDDSSSIASSMSTGAKDMSDSVGPSLLFAVLKISSDGIIGSSGVLKTPSYCIFSNSEILDGHYISFFAKTSRGPIADLIVLNFLAYE